MDRRHQSNQQHKKRDREREREMLDLIMGDQGISQELQSDQLELNYRIKIELHQALDLSRKTF